MFDHLVDWWYEFGTELLRLIEGQKKRFYARDDSGYLHFAVTPSEAMLSARAANLEMA